MDFYLLIMLTLFIDLFNVWFLRFVNENDLVYWIFSMLPITNFLLSIHFFVFLYALLEEYKLEQKFVNLLNQSKEVK